MLSDYEKSIEQLIVNTNTKYLRIIECTDAVTGERVAVVALVDIFGRIKRSIARLFSENESPHEFLIPRNDAQSDSPRGDQSPVTDEQFLRQMGIDPMGSDVGNGDHAS
jgi:hypothetical protein